MKIKLLILIMLLGLGANAQYTNVGANGIQRQVVAGDTTFRHNLGAAGFIYTKSLASYKNMFATSADLSGKANLAGGNSFSGNQTIAGNLYMPFNRWIAYNNTSPLAPVHIGNRNVLNSTNAQILVAGIYDNSFPTSGHAFSDGTLITGVAGSKAYAAYDGRVDIQGTGVNMDHYVSFQHGPNLNFTGTLTDNFGVYTTTLQQAGTLTNNYGGYFANPTRTGGTMTNNTAIYIANQTAGTNNYSIYSAGGFNYFGGSMQVDGTMSLNSTGQNMRLKADGSTALDAGLFVNAIGDLALSNWDYSNGFVKKGNGIGYYFGGNFGVKTATPTEDFEVAGSALVSENSGAPNSVVRNIDLGTGWATYADGIYDFETPLTISSGVTDTLPNNAANIINSQIPLGVTSFYNSGTTKITPELNGDSYLINVRFKARSNNASGLLDVLLDIGGSMNVIDAETVSLRKGTDVEQQVNVIFDIYSGSTFVANGGLIKVNSIIGDTEIYDIQYKITRTHKAR